MPATAFSLTGNPYIDGILTGVRWNQAVVTYGFPTAADQYRSGYPYASDHDQNPSTPTVQVDERTKLQTLTSAQRTAVEAVFTELGQLVSGLRFAWQMDPPGGADIRLAMTTAPDPGRTPFTAYAFDPGDGLGGDVWFNTTQYTSPVLGSYAYQTDLLPRDRPHARPEARACA